MKKQRIQLIVLLGVLVVLLGGIKLVQYLTEKQAKEDAQVDVITVLDLSAEYLTSIAYNYEDVDYEFVKEEDTWFAAQDESLTITQYMITAMANKLTPLTAEDVLENVEDLSQYGLSEAERYVKCQADGVTYEILIGDYNELTGKYYICLSGENTVYTVAESFALAFNKTLEDVVEVEEESTEETEEVEAEDSDAEAEILDGEVDAEVAGDVETDVETDAEVADDVEAEVEADAADADTEAADDNAVDVETDAEVADAAEITE